MYYFKQNLKGISEQDSKTLYLLFKTAKAGYNELVNQADKTATTPWYELNNKVVTDSVVFKRLGANLTRTIVTNFNINMKNYVKNQAKDASYTKPTFRHKNSEFFIAFFGRTKQINYFKNEVTLILNSKTITFPISKKFANDRRDIVQVRLHKSKVGYYLVYHYEANIERIAGQNKAGIDLGVDALITCYTQEYAPLIISGKYLKYVNYKYKMLLEQDISEEAKDIIFAKRDNEIKSIFNFAIKRLFDYLRYTGTTEIFIGDFVGVKESGKAVARNFYMISYYLLKRKMKDYAAKNGVRINFIKEDYTSKTSFLDFEEPKYHGSYMGNREERGLFITKEGKRIHADVNGAAQILTKRVFTKDRENILLKPFFIDLVKDHVKLKSSLNFKIWTFLNKEYKRVSKINEIYKIFEKDPIKFNIRKMVSFDSLTNNKVYVYYKFDANLEILFETK